MKTFWMVQGSKSRRALVRHKTRADAGAEATRLANLNPGKPYFIMEAVDFVCVGPPAAGHVVPGVTKSKRKKV